MTNKIEELPVTEKIDGDQPATSFTKKELAAILLRFAVSGHNWLDSMIIEANKLKEHSVQNVEDKII